MTAIMNFNEVITLIKEANHQPAYQTEEYKEWLSQKDFISLLSLSTMADLPVFVCMPKMLIHSILLPRKALKKLDIEELISWDCSITETWGISYQFGSNRMPTKIKMAAPFEDSIHKVLREAQPITFLRSIEGMERPSYIEISQAITHPHALHHFPEHSAYCRLDNKGDLSKLIQLYQKNNENFLKSEKVVTFQRELLDLHLFVSDSVLIRFFDSTRYDYGNFNSWHQKEETIKHDDKEIYAKYGFQANASYLRGFQIIRCIQPRKKMLNIVRYGEEEAKKYETFIAHDFKHSMVGEFSCDPKKLGNYFVPSELPFETSPAFFNPEVLSKYKNDPEKYTITARSISCRNAWHLQTYDINRESGQVHTYLKYLGNLPYSEQKYWRSFNEKPKDGISRRAFKTDFQGAYDNEGDPISTLKILLQELEQDCPGIWQCPDNKLWKELHYPMSNSQKEWSNAIHTLDKIFVEGLSTNYLKKKAQAIQCEIEKEWKSIKILETILNKQNVDSAISNQIISTLKEFHGLRTTFSGHASKEKAQLARNKILETHDRFSKHFEYIAQQCVIGLKNLIELAKQKII